MTKKQSKTSKRKPPPRGSRAGPAAGPKTAAKQNPMSMALVKRVCAITDPFCDAAVGAKWVDNSSVRSLAQNIHAVVNLSTDADGNGAHLICPGYLNQIAPMVTGIGGVFTFNNFTTIFSGLNGVSGYRLVSWGARVKSIGAPLYASGIVRIRGFSTPAGGALTTINSATYTDNYLDIPTQDCKDVCIVGNKLTNLSSIYRSPQETNPTGVVANWVSPGWAPVMISVVGAQASISAIQVEYFFHVEVIFEDGQPLSLLATPPPTTSPIVTAASNLVSKAAGGIFSRGVKEVERMVIKAASSALGTLLGGPALGAAAGSMAAITVD